MYKANLLEGKVAVVTGAARGIGRDIAFALALSGANVAFVDVNENAAIRAMEEAKEDAKEEAKEDAKDNATNKGHSAYACDVSDFTQTKAICDEIISYFGKVDILVNNAGITKDGLLLSMKEEDFDQVMDVNLKGTFNFTKHLSRYLMKSSSGRIINISSVVGVAGNAGQANYSASKAGVIGFTKTIARELASRKVTCNVIAPGFIATDMTEVLSDAVKEKVVKSIPLGRMGEPSEIASLAVFLASEAAAYITGEVIKVDGGMCI